MEKNCFEWTSFAKRNGKLFAVCLAGVLFFWNSVVLGEWVYALFGGELRGYGPPQQRWHRVWAMGFVIMYVFGTAIGLYNIWYYRKHPEEAERLKNRKEEPQDEKTYEATASPMRASFIESTPTGNIVHRAELSKKEQGYALRLIQAGQDDCIERFESEEAVKQYLEENTLFRWGDFFTVVVK